MLDPRHLWSLATHLPRAFSGAKLHRFGLEAMSLGESVLADRLFEAAAARYRSALAVEPLARLRVHQLIARVRSVEHLDWDSELVLEVERLLTRLQRIESLTPPFELVEARTLLATWLSGIVDAAGAAEDAPTARAA